MNLEELSLKSICLVVHNVEKEEDMHVYLGKLKCEDNEYFFINEDRGYRVPLNADHLNRLRPVPEELKSVLLNADYCLQMTLGSLPDSESDGYGKTGLKWHEDADDTRNLFNEQA